MGKRRTTSETTYVVTSSGCGKCYGYGYIELVDIDYQPYDRVACYCAAGKQWSGKAA